MSLAVEPNRASFVTPNCFCNKALNLNPLLLPARIELSQVNEILDAERNRRVEQEKKRKAEEQKRVEQEKKQKVEEKEKQKREEDRRNRERKKSQDTVSQVLGFIKKIFFLMVILVP